ncbi:YggS family pyridoxal phosphate enzyme [Oceaniferula spumae]|uniref:Pyridoxal phosphate homeostasis protein n=1 Tax=Oceaniferula spumae TaxID=2979115 RepID=A0AAT9FRS2_9BACT
MMADVIADNLLEVRQRVQQAAEKSGRSASDCELLVVSKTWPAENVAQVAAAGQLSFGENKVQEAEGKIPSLPSHLHWHLIGHLQRNKVRKALPLFDTIHSIDSLKLARYTSNIAVELDLKPQVYLQVNLAGEQSKDGYDLESLHADFEQLLELQGIQIQGLMCIPPVAATPEDARPWFAQLRNLRDHLESQGGQSLPGLSMGMSGDYEVAIEEGSTIVRVGSAIFGKRYA